LLRSSWLALTVSCFALLTATQSARADSASLAVELARSTYIDSFPVERARALDAEGVAALAALLRNPAEARAHCNAVTALGWSGRAEAAAALIEYASAAPVGEVERPRYCALARVPLALGHLARGDDGALAWLLAEAARGAHDPGWHRGRQRGERLALWLDEQVRTGLALSGRPEADPWLRDAPLKTPASLRVAGVLAARRERLLEALRALHERIAREGAGAALASPYAAPER
jgi:hypothetical protein